MLRGGSATRRWTFRPDQEIQFKTIINANSQFEDQTPSSAV